MEVKLHQILYLYEVFLENMDSDNCYEVLKEEFNTMFGVSFLNDNHGCNVSSMNSLNIHDVIDDCIGHDNDVSYKNVNFCGVNWECKSTPEREDRFCKKHKYLETKNLQERLDDCAERFNFFAILVNFAMNVVI